MPKTKNKLSLVNHKLTELDPGDLEISKSVVWFLKNHKKAIDILGQSYFQRS